MTGDFDLFGAPLAPARVGRSAARRHPTEENRRKIISLVADGLTHIQIARALVIAPSTLYRQYFVELGVRPGEVGRREHQPTSESRARVERLAREYLPRPVIAQSIGISVPTLAKHYAAELAGECQRPKLRKAGRRPK